MIKQLKYGILNRRRKKEEGWNWDGDLDSNPILPLYDSGEFNPYLEVKNQNQNCLQTLTGHEDRIDCVVFSPNGNIIASAGCDKIIKLWDLNTGECLHSLQAHTQRIRMVVFTSLTSNAG